MAGLSPRDVPKMPANEAPFHSVTRRRQFHRHAERVSDPAVSQPRTASGDVDLSVVIPALHEAQNLVVLLPALQAVLRQIGVPFEILIVTSNPDAATRDAATTWGADVIEQPAAGYGQALVTGFAHARGQYVMTMDADLSHRPVFIRDMWQRRHEAEITVASRYVPGGRARMPRSRYALSVVLNKVFSRGLSLRIRDMSSGFRLYAANVVRGGDFRAVGFDILQQILVRAYMEGWRVQEVPFEYAPREHGKSHARVFRFGLAYARTFWSLWKLRNSILAADYDDRAYDSPIPLQRYWQRTRFRHVTELMEGQGAVLDVGCGSSRIISALPAGSVALDVLLRKVRYARKFGKPLVMGSGFSLPFRDESFPCVVCSQVIEHVPKESTILAELCRVLAPGGRLVLGTPDYARPEWTITERLYGLFAPGGYADEHIAHYTRRELIGLFESQGFRVEAVRYVLRGELILAFRKPPRPAAA